MNIRESTNNDLIKSGFIITVITSRKYKIVRAIQRSDYDGQSYALDNPPKEAEVKCVLYERGDINICKTIVIVDGWECEIKYIKKMLRKPSLIIGIATDAITTPWRNCKHFTTWELHTDTPSAA